MKGLKKNIRTGLESFLDVFGIEAHLRSKDKKADRELLDKNILSHFFNKNDRRMTLYREGLKRSGVEWSDNFLKQCRFYSLQEMVEYVLKRGPEGEFAECGCWKGHSTFIISKLLAAKGFRGGFHVFDSFEGGLSERSPEDKHERLDMTRREIEGERRMFASREEEVKEVLSEFDFVKLYKGWIPDRFNEVAHLKFSFVHIDVDLYEPVRSSLNWFYPRLLDGGCIVLDDYAASTFPGCKKAVDEFLARTEHSIFYEIPIGGCFIIK